MLRKGDRIEFTHPKTKELTFGVVTKGGAGKVQFTTDAGESYSGPASLLKPSKQPLPAGSQIEPAKLSKGDRVEYDTDGAVKYGVVAKGGQRVTVILDGAKYEVRGSADSFRLSNHPLPKDAPHAMDDWGVERYAAYERMSEETTAMDAVVTYKGKPVLSARNDGHGGCNYYSLLPGAPKDIDRKLEADARQWALDHGLGDTSYFEGSDAWLTWKTTLAHYGVTAKSHFTEWEERRRQLASRMPGPSA